MRRSASRTARRSRRAVVLADTDVAALLLDLVGASTCPRASSGSCSATRGAGAPSRSTGRSTARCRGASSPRGESAVVHAGDSLDDLSRLHHARSAAASCPTIPTS